MSVRRKIYC